MRAGFYVAVKVRRRETGVSEPCKSSQPAKCVSKWSFTRNGSRICLCVICNNETVSRLSGMCKEKGEKLCEVWTDGGDLKQD